MSSTSSSSTSSSDFSSASEDLYENGLDDYVESRNSILRAPKSRLFSPYCTLTNLSGTFTVDCGETKQFITLYNKKQWQIATADKLQRTMQNDVPQNIRKSTGKVDTESKCCPESDIVCALNDMRNQRTLVCTKHRIYLYKRGVLELCDEMLGVVSCVSLSRGGGLWTVALLIEHSAASKDDSDSSSDNGHESTSDADDMSEADSGNGQVIIRIIQIPYNNKEIITANDIFLPDIMKACAIVHPPTYINKVVVSGKDGDNNGVLFLVNVRTGKVVYRFRCCGGDGVSCYGLLCLLLLGSNFICILFVLNLRLNQVLIFIP